MSRQLRHRTVPCLSRILILRKPMDRDRIRIMKSEIRLRYTVGKVDDRERLGRPSPDLVEKNGSEDGYERGVSAYTGKDRDTWSEGP